MADHGDVAGTKILRREFIRRKIDLTLADLRVSHGVAYIRGTIKLMRGADGDVKSIVDTAVRSLRSKPEIRDVIIDAVFRT